MLAIIRGNALIAAATLVSILGSALLSLNLFAPLFWYQYIFLALVLTVIANGMLYAAAISIALICRIRYPGVVLYTVLGTCSGALAISLTGWAVPSIVLVGFTGAIFTGFFNTMLVWALAFGSGALKPGLKLWPSFETQQ